MATVGVVGRGPSAGDDALTSALTTAGHSVTFIEQPGSVPGGFDVFVITESCSGAVGTTFASTTVPIVCLEVGAHQALGLAPVNGSSTGVSSEFFELFAHEISAGLPNPCQVRASPAGNWGIANADVPAAAVKFAGAGSFFSEHAVGWALEHANGRRVALGYIDSWPASLTIEGMTLFLNAVTWAAPAGGPTPVQGSAALAAASALSVAGRSPARGTAVLAAAAGLTADGRSPARGTAAVVSSSAVQTAARSRARGRAALGATSQLAVAAPLVESRDITLTIGPPGFNWAAVSDPFPWTAEPTPFLWVAIADPFTWSTTITDPFTWEAAARAFTWAAAADPFTWAAGPPHFDD